MKIRTIALTLATLIVTMAVCFAADDAFMGTWKLNRAKSKGPSASGRTSTVVFAVAGGSVKVTGDGVDASGKPIHIEWTGKFDGKDYPVTGSPNADMRSYTRVNDHTLIATQKKGAKILETDRTEVSADGKSRTATIESTDAKGNKVTSTRVFDKQ